jgi:hypothetical protein
VDAFEQYVHGGLARMGLIADETDVQIMRYVDEVFGAELTALLAEDLRGEWVEPDLDPGRAPSS